MRRLSPEQLLLVVFLVVTLLSVLLRLWHRRRTGGAGADQREPVAPEAPARVTRPRAVQPAPIGGSGNRPRRENPGIPAKAPPGSGRLTASARLDPSAARRAVVLMAILGPCRALEPWQPPVLEARGSAGPPPVAR